MATRDDNEDADMMGFTLFGQQVRLSGKNTIYMGVTLLALAGCAYLLWHISTDALDDQTRTLIDRQERLAAEHKMHTDLLRQHEERSTQQHLENNAALRALVDAIDIQNYIITLDDKDRKALNLRMPDGLIEKQRKRSHAGGP